MKLSLHLVCSEIRPPGRQHLRCFLQTNPPSQGLLRQLPRLVALFSGQGRLLLQGEAYSAIKVDKQLRIHSERGRQRRLMLQLSPAYRLRQWDHLHQSQHSALAHHRLLAVNQQEQQQPRSLRQPSSPLKLMPLRHQRQLHRSQP
jgi:hypothetical protein